MDAFTARCSKINQASAKLIAREAAALAALHRDDRQDAQMSAHENATDTMAERGVPYMRQSTFAFRKAYIATLEMLADCAPDFGYRRAVS